MRYTPDELQNVAHIKRTIRKAVNGHSEMCDSISQIDHVLGLMGLRSYRVKLKAMNLRRVTVLGNFPYFES